MTPMTLMQPAHIPPVTPPNAPWRTELGPFLRIGIPMGLTQLLQFSFVIVDVLMIGRLGPDHLAASGVGGMVWFAMWVVCAGPIIAVGPLISQAIGADPDNVTDVRHSVRMGLWAAGLSAPIGFVVFFFADQIIMALGQPSELAAMARAFALSLTLVLPLSLGTMILRVFLAPLTMTQIPLVIIAVASLLNALLNYVFIFGNWGAPRLELVGAGLASVLSEAFKVLALLIYIRWDRRSRRFHLFRDFFAPQWDRLREIARLGWPITVEIALWNYLNISALFLMGQVGVHEMAAFQVARNNVAAVAVMLPLGLSGAGAVRVGLAAGARDQGRVRQASLIAIMITPMAALLIAVPCIVWPETIGAFYLDPNKPENGSVLDLLAVFLPIAGLFSLLDTVQFTVASCLRALKDVRMLMILSAACYWLVGFPLAAYMGLYTSLGAYGVWWGLMAGLATGCVVLALRLWLLIRPRQDPEPAPCVP